MDEVLPGPGPLAERVQAHRKADEIPAAKLAECVDAMSSALRDLVRARSRCRRRKPSNTKWWGTSRGPGSTTTSVTIAPKLRSIPISRSSWRICRD